MPNLAKWIMALLALAAVCAAVSEYRRRKKLKQKIDREFGQEPTSDPGLGCAQRFWAAYAEALPQKPALDQITWNDLNMDSVYASINCCQSGVGGCWLYSTLRTNGGLNGSELESGELTDFFSGDTSLRRRVQYRLALLGPHGADGIETALFASDSLALPHPSLYFLLAALPFLSFLFWPFVGAGAGLLLGAVALATNFLLTFYLRNRPQSGFHAINSFAAVLFCAKKTAQLLEKKDLDFFKRLARTTRTFRRFDLPASVIHFSDFSFQMGILDPSSLFLLPILSYIYLIRQLQKHQEASLLLVKLLGELDVAIGILAYRSLLPYFCIPRWTQEKTVVFTKGYHPLLERPVANSAEFCRSALLTGSNASGKSTFVKTVAVNCILAQTIYTCCAETFCMHKGLVLTSMALRDDLFEGKSYFVTELESIQRILAKVQTEAFCYVFIDEILRGTNTTERIAASCAVLEYLARQNCLVMAATHDLELTRLLEPQFENYHFREEMADGAIRFDYRLHKGPSATKNALKLMEAMQYPPPVLRLAEDLIQTHDASGVWTACKSSRSEV